MNKQKRPSSRAHRDADAASPASPDDVTALHEQIADLKAALKQIRDARDALAADRDELRAENLRLRREMTLAHLVEGLESSLEEVVDPGSPVPPPARRLYDRLPTSFAFPAYFRTAEAEGLETTTARRYLVRYLADGRLVPSGAYLEKDDPAGDGPGDAGAEGPAHWE
jgi:hypothetical protein